MPVNGEAACHDDYLYIPRGQHLDDVTQKYTEERCCFIIRSRIIVRRNRHIFHQKILSSADSLVIMRRFVCSRL